MLRRSVLAVLMVLVASTPAAAEGFRSTVGVIGPSRAERPFISAPLGTIGMSPIPRPLPTPREVITSRDGSVVVPVPDPRFDHRFDHRFRSPVVVVPAPAPVVVIEQYAPPVTAYAPSQCQTAGYWAYRQVPFTATQNVWVEGAWGADGRWVDSHYEMRPYTSFYNEPFWVPSQSYGC
jgi:hypothetical protein